MLKQIVQVLLTLLKSISQRRVDSKQLCPDLLGCSVESASRHYSIKPVLFSIKLHPFCPNLLLLVCLLMSGEFYRERE